jgi:hypothetical protein
MSICASGASRAKSTSAAAVVIDAAYIKSLLPAALVWLYDYLPAFERLELGNVGTFCASDPPTWTVPTSAELFSYLTGGPIGNALQVQGFIGDVARAYIWYQLCECTSGATPAAPAPPSPPANLPAVNPPGVVSLPNAAPCYSSSIAGVVVSNGATYSTGGPFWRGRSGTSVVFKLTNTVYSGAGCQIQFGLYWEQTYPSFSVLHTDGYTVLPGGSIQVTLPVWAETDECTIHVVGSTGTGLSTGAWAADVYCGGAAPGLPQVPCCPPDPVLTARVDQILDMVTLIQRQSVPFGYVASTVHAGLTGSGALSVSGLLGCKVDMTTIPSSYGQSAGTPAEHFDLGFVTFGSPDGYPSSKRLEHQPTLFLPARCGAYTDLAYSLAPGVVATITELLREP